MVSCTTRTPTPSVTTPSTRAGAAARANAARSDADHTLPSQDVEAHFSARPADAARLTLANSRLFGTNGAYASARARVGDTRRILGLRNSGEEAEWCGAHMATTRRRMDRISTVAPPTSYESASRDETVDETN